MIRSFTSVFHLNLVHYINVTDIEMTNQLLGLNKLNLSPSKNWELKKVVNGSSLIETHLIHLSPTEQLFNSTWVQTKFCPKWALFPFVVPDVSYPKGSSVLRVDLVCLRTCWTLVLTWSLKWFALVDREFSSSIGTEQQPPRHQPDTLDSTWDKIILPYWTWRQ